MRAISTTIDIGRTIINLYIKTKDGFEQARSNPFLLGHFLLMDVAGRLAGDVHTQRLKRLFVNV